MPIRTYSVFSLDKRKAAATINALLNPENKFMRKKLMTETFEDPMQQKPSNDHQAMDADKPAEKKDARNMETVFKHRQLTAREKASHDLKLLQVVFSEDDIPVPILFYLAEMSFLPRLTRVILTKTQVECHFVSTLDITDLLPHYFA